MGHGNLEISDSKSVKLLLSSYTTVSPTAIISKHSAIHALDFQLHHTLTPVTWDMQPPGVVRSDSLSGDQEGKTNNLALQEKTV